MQRSDRGGNRRWGCRWELVRLPDDPRDADVQRMYSLLVQAIPEQRRASVGHGDYRIDNTILDSEDATRVRAVLDGELSTVGGPVSDAARMCVDRDPMFDVIVDINAAWICALLRSGDALAHRYSV